MSRNANSVVFLITMEDGEFQNELIRIKDKLYRMAYVMLLNEEDASDLTQETLLILWKKKNLLKKMDNVEAYGIRVIKNLCFDLNKRQHLFKNQILPKIGNRNLKFYQNYEEKEALQVLMDSLKKIEIKHRLIFVMKTIEGYSYEEIENLTGFTQENLRQIISRTRKYLRVSLKKQYDHG